LIIDWRYLPRLVAPDTRAGGGAPATSIVWKDDYPTSQPVGSGFKSHWRLNNRLSCPCLADKALKALKPTAVSWISWQSIWSCCQFSYSCIWACQRQTCSYTLYAPTDLVLNVRQREDPFGPWGATGVLWPCCESGLDAAVSQRDSSLIFW